MVGLFLLFPLYDGTALHRGPKLDAKVCQRCDAEIFCACLPRTLMIIYVWVNVSHGFHFGHVLFVLSCKSVVGTVASASMPDGGVTGASSVVGLRFPSGSLSTQSPGHGQCAA